MFLSEMMRHSGMESECGTLEMVSLGQEGTVAVSGHQCRRAFFGPAGMCWVPQRGQGVLVLKAGLEECVAGVEMECAEDMEPGEVKLFSRGASVWLKNDGSILLEGNVLVNGKELTV